MSHSGEYPDGVPSGHDHHGFGAPPPLPPPQEGSSHQPQQPPSHPAESDTAYDDPTNLLRVYPFATYQPTARAAMHFAPHTVVYPPPTFSSDLYPQHSDFFRKLDTPSTAEDWAMRNQTQAQIRNMLNTSGPSYYNSYLPTPGPSAPTASQLTPYPTPNPSLPYNFLSSYLPSPATSSREATTPTSHVGQVPSASSSTSAAEYFHDFVKQTLTRKEQQEQQQRQQQQQQQQQRFAPSLSQLASQHYSHPPSHTDTPGDDLSRTPSTINPRDIRRPSSAASISSTPGLANAMERAALTEESPDPLSLTGPSPSKKRKSSRQISPTLQYSKSLPQVKHVPNPLKDLHKSQLFAHSSSSSSLLTPPPSSELSPTKQKMVVEVMIPTRRSTSPVKSVGMQQEERDDDDEESEEDDLAWEKDDHDKDGNWQMSGDGLRSPSPGIYGRSAPPGSGRTGERDMRSHLQKLQSFLEDIFEESDSFPADPTMKDVTASHFFSSISKDGAYPLLSDATLGKITRYLNRLQKGKRRQGHGDRIEWDTDMLGRVVRLIERCMRDTEDLNPFVDDKEVAIGKKGKSSTVKKGSKSPDPHPTMLAKIESEDAMGDSIISEEETREGESRLNALRSAGLAAESCLMILSLEGLSKQLLSEDLIYAAARLVKDQMSKVIVPVTEALAGEKTSSMFLDHIVKLESTRSIKSKRLSPVFVNTTLASITTSCVASLPRLTALISRPDITFSDHLVIQSVYLAITPLFVTESVVKKSKKDMIAGLAVMKGLRVEALACLRATFAKYEDQRQWIIEEILSSMGKATDTNNSLARFQLANGASIHTVSALLLQLVQASAFGVTSRVWRLRSSALEEGRASGSQTPSDTVDDLDEESRVCAETMESALKSARIVATYLMKRSGSSKSNKSAHDTDYKAFLDVFVADLLSVLYRPEWPAAPLYLTVLSRLMMSALEDRSTSAGDTAAKSVALDYLGEIAAKLRAFQLQMGQSSVSSLDELISTADINACSSLSAKHRSIQAFLSTAARDDGMYAGALDMASLIWAQELQNAIKKATSIIEKLSAEKNAEAQETRERLQTIGQSLRSSLRSIWIGDDDVFEISDPNGAALANQTSVSVSRGRTLQTAFNPILGALVSSMGNSIIAIRSKALRGLGSIISVDPDVLGYATVRAAIEDRLSDSSPSVRDAAVELVGKYVVQKPNLALEYYPHLALRVSDSGLAVRKRVIKLLRGTFAATSIRDIKVDICCKMVTLTGDTDDNIKDLATKTVTDMFYASDGAASVTAALLVDVIAEYQGGAVFLEGAMQEIARECVRSGQDERLDKTIDALFNQLTDATERSDIDPLTHIRAIHLLSTARPDLVDVTRAEILTSYRIKKPANSDEQSLNEVLLKIFRLCIPTMPRVASNFALKLNDDLVGMISVPSGGFSTLKETIACFCTVANHLTREFSSILKILISCEAKVRNMRNEWISTQQATKALSPATPFLLFICASIAEYCNLDQLADTDTTVRAGISKITDGSLFEHLFECFLDFSAMPIPQIAPSMCLGSLFRAYPVLILREEAMNWMDGVFAGNDWTTQARLLTVIYDFLVSESEKKQAPASIVTPRKGGKGKKGKEMGDLIGNAADLSESGLSTAVVQRNIGHILDGAKSLQPAMQNAALDILAFTVNQGLYHPLQCLPILISLETSENDQIAERALDLHRTLHSKHSTLVNVRYEEFAKASYQYQRSITSEVVGHRDGIALLSGWFSLIGEKRSWRHDFLKQLARAFDYDLTGKVLPDVGFVMYLCDNLCTLEYKLQEEVMTVIHLMSGVVSSSTSLIMLLEHAVLKGELVEDIAGKVIQTSEEEETVRADVVIHASIVVGLAILVKNHLLDVYSISEDKCIKHVPGKKSVMGDKPAVMRREGGLDTSRMSLVRGVSTVEDFASQKTTFLELVHEDGLVGKESD